MFELRGARKPPATLTVYPVASFCDTTDNILQAHLYRESKHNATIALRLLADAVGRMMYHNIKKLQGFISLTQEMIQEFSLNDIYNVVR